MSFSLGIFVAIIMLTAAIQSSKLGVRRMGRRLQVPSLRASSSQGALIDQQRKEENSRFWSRILPISLNFSSTCLPSERLEQLRIALIDEPDALRVSLGVAILPGHDQTTMLVPLHNGTLQPQHATLVPNSEKPSVLLCAFSPKASHVVVSPNEEERPVDPERLAALNAALLSSTSTTAEELLGETLAGTPPARIYRSFVSPRPGRKNILEPVERAAVRTAAQIDLSLRQVRADQDAYLRNTDRAVISLNGKDEGQKTRVSHPVVLILDNIRSAFNVGSLFRTSETAGVSELITCGITAHPPHPKLRKTAMQSVDYVPTRHFDDVMAAVVTLKSEGYTIAAMETTRRSISYTSIDYPKKLALVLGNELTGVDTRVMDAANLLIEIPTYGVKNSLCVSSAAPVVLFEVLRQWNR